MTGLKFWRIQTEMAKRTPLRSLQRGSTSRQDWSPIRMGGLFRKLLTLSIWQIPTEMAKQITGKFYSQDGERSIPMPGPVIYDMDLTIRSGEWWGIQLLMEQWGVWNTVLAVDSTDLHRTAHPWRASPTPPTTPGASGFRKMALYLVLPQTGTCRFIVSFLTASTTPSGDTARHPEYRLLQTEPLYFRFVNLSVRWISMATIRPALVLNSIQPEIFQKSIGTRRGSSANLPDDFWASLISIRQVLPIGREMSSIFLPAWTTGLHLSRRKWGPTVRSGLQTGTT